jgi:glycosyltransferase involved in cell wall biosynthesis
MIPAPISKYPPHSRLMRPLWFPAAVAARIPGVLRTLSGDVTLLCRELVSTFMTLEPLTRRPRVLDVDDAIWLSRKGNGIRRIAGMVEAVIAGNEFLAGWFGQYCNDVTIVPTAVDVDRFAPPLHGRPQGGRIVIGWSGTSSNHSALAEIETPLLHVLAGSNNAMLRILSDMRPRFNRLPPEKWDFVKWNPEVEVPTIQGFDIGLMPLRDDDWSRGKCSYKMLLYMACGVPVIVSPVGMNKQVLALGDCGHAAVSLDDWEDSMRSLLLEEDIRREMGRAGRQIVVEHFSLSAIVLRLEEVFRRLAGRRNCVCVG